MDGSLFKILRTIENDLKKSFRNIIIKSVNLLRCGESMFLNGLNDI